MPDRTLRFTFKGTPEEIPLKGDPGRTCLTNLKRISEKETLEELFEEFYKKNLGESPKERLEKIFQVKPESYVQNSELIPMPAETPEGISVEFKK